MTNLEYLSEFLTQTFGAICFHNDTQDGYVTMPTSDKKIETLSVYFPNEIDLDNQSVKNRLQSVAGKEFYLRYAGAKDIKMSAMCGNYLFACFYSDNQVLEIYANPTYVRLGGGISFVIQYFLGKDITGQKLQYPLLHKQVKTNNDFSLPTGSDIKTVIEEYLTKRGLLLVTERNGFYVENKMQTVEQRRKLTEQSFRTQLQTIGAIGEQRNAEFQNALANMSKNDWLQYKQDLGVQLQTVQKNDQFDD